MYARDLNGRHIGQGIIYERAVYNESTGEHDTTPVITDDITMILHKKNGDVHIRHGKKNRQLTFKSHRPIIGVTTSA